MTDNSELICEFLGWEPRKYADGRTNYMVPNIYPMADISTGETETEWEQMEFRFRWDWLMPVVEKCLHNQRGKWHDRTRTLYVDIEIALGKVDIAETYTAVVEWIKWYDLQTKEK